MCGLWVSLSSRIAWPQNGPFDFKRDPAADSDKWPNWAALAPTHFAVRMRAVLRKGVHTKPGADLGASTACGPRARNGRAPHPAARGVQERRLHGEA